MDSYIFAVHKNLSHDIYISPSIINTGQWEPCISSITTRILKNYASHKKQVQALNIGGNIGWYTILMAKAAPNIFVDSFEPCRKNYLLLCENIRLQALEKRIRPCRCAVADLPGKGNLFIDNKNAGDNALVQQARIGGQEEVEITTLDSFYADNMHSLPDMAIIDTQGCEQRIMNGAKTLFANNWRPLLFLEFWPGGMKEHGKKVDYPSRLKDMGYTFYRMDPKVPAMNAISVEWLDAFSTRLREENNKEGFIDICAVPPHMDITALLS